MVGTSFVCIGLMEISVVTVESFFLYNLLIFDFTILIPIFLCENKG